MPTVRMSIMSAVRMSVMPTLYVVARSTFLSTSHTAFTIFPMMMIKRLLGMVLPGF